MSGYANHLRYGSCFVAGTLVATATGYVAIEKIRAGDLVWAWDEKTGDVALKPIVETYINETTELTHIFVGGEEIIATPTHPFYCPVKGWTDAAHLRAGDILVLVNGEYVVVEQIQHELLESPIKVIPIMYPIMGCWCIMRVLHGKVNCGRTCVSEAIRIITQDMHTYITVQQNLHPWMNLEKC